jgi:hypothetical protein
MRRLEIPATRNGRSRMPEGVRKSLGNRTLDTERIGRNPLDNRTDMTGENAIHQNWVQKLQLIPKLKVTILAPAVHNATKVLGGSFVRGSSRF